MTDSGISFSSKYDNDNIFAKIIQGDIPCIKVYEDDTTLAFMDIMPQADGHTLVISKIPAVTLLELPPEAASDLINKVQLVMKAVQEGLNAEGITLFQLNGSTAGQTVPHVHFHIVPGSVLGSTNKGHAAEMGDQEMVQKNADKIKAYL